MKKPELIKVLIVFTAAILLLINHNYAQSSSEDTVINKQTFLYAVKDTAHLNLDIYSKKFPDSGTKRPCVIFVFGGAFIGGHRDDTLYNRYFHALAENNFIVISISYRLGLRGAKHLSIFNTKPLKNAIDMAVEDVFDATAWTITHAAMLHVDTSKIILSGSSAGAITVLQTDFTKRNNSTPKLSDSFQYAGVVSFSGAILTYNGSLKYKIPPAPTMMFHGTADKIVPYNKIWFFNKRFYGSSSIANTFNKNQYYYYIYRETGLGHEVSIYPMYENLPDILGFINNYIILKKKYQADFTFKDDDLKPRFLLSAKELFQKLQK